MKTDVCYPSEGFGPEVWRATNTAVYRQTFQNTDTACQGALGQVYSYPPNQCSCTGGMTGSCVIVTVSAAPTSTGGQNPCTILGCVTYAEGGMTGDCECAACDNGHVLIDGFCEALVANQYINILVWPSTQGTCQGTNALIHSYSSGQCYPNGAGGGEIYRASLAYVYKHDYPNSQCTGNSDLTSYVMTDCACDQEKCTSVSLSASPEELPTMGGGGGVSGGTIAGIVFGLFFFVLFVVLCVCARVPTCTFYESLECLRECPCCVSSRAQSGPYLGHKKGRRQNREFALLDNDNDAL